MAGSRAEVGSAAALFRLMQDVQQMLPFAGRRGQSVGPPWLKWPWPARVDGIVDSRGCLAPVTVTHLSLLLFPRLHHWQHVTTACYWRTAGAVRNVRLQLVIISVSFTYPRLVYPFTLAYTVVISRTLSSPDAHQNSKKYPLLSNW